MNEQDVFLHVLKLAGPAERLAFLNEACRDQPQLRQRVEVLLRAHERAGAFLDSPAAGSVGTMEFEPMVERPGTIIGPYKLLQQIGEGGMGVVYMADQETPVRRRVALKIIKPGMDSRQVIARFEAERQALAMMDHQNIAKVLDAGTTQSGRPYFVMELVHGVPLTKFCDDNRLTPRERLELFIPVCQAIQHAHQKGVIHRDIKPTNILVTMYDDKPVPKVIDFGVAKAVEQRLTEKTLFTQYGTLVGTFEYMSPEQAEMNAYGVDTRSDIYSLGVLLYELLTGTTPLERPKLREAALIELVRMIKEDEPPRPSIRLSSTSTLPKFAASCRTEPARLSQLLRGELDWIVMKCLEKDRTRRYETANNLARDVQRYLKDEPVEACPPSLSYRMSKFARRYKTPLAVAAGFVVLLISGVTVSTWQAVRAINAEKVAVENERGAVKAAEAAKIAKEAEANQRRLAEASEQEALRERNSTVEAKEELRHTLYASEMNLVQAAWESRQYRRVAQLLDQQKPEDGQPDLRGFEWHYWQRKLENGRVSTISIPRLAQIADRVAVGHSGTPVRFTGDGTLLTAIVSQSSGPDQAPLLGTVSWDSATGREVRPFKPLTLQSARVPTQFVFMINYIPAPSMSDDGSTGAVGTLNRILVLNGDTGEETSSWTRRFATNLTEFALSPDGSHAALVDSLSTVPAVAGGFGSGAFRSSRTRLLQNAEVQQELSLTEDQRAKLSQIVGDSRGQPASERPASTFPVVGGFGSLGGSGITRTRLLQNAEVQQELSLTEDQRAKFKQIVSESRRQAASERPASTFTGRESTVQIWDTSTGTMTRTLPALSGTAERILWSPDGARMLRQVLPPTVRATEGESQRDQCHFQLVDATSGEEIWSRKFPIVLYSKTWSRDGSLIAVSEPGNTAEEATLQLWDAKTGATLAILNRGHASYISEQNVVFSPDGKLLAAATIVNEIYGWEAARLLPSGEVAEPRRVAVPPLVLRHVGEPIRAISFSTDSRQLHAVAGTSLITWDATVRDKAGLGLADTRGIASIACFSADGTKVVFGESLWDIVGNRQLCQFGGGRTALTCFAMTPDARRVAAVPTGNRPLQILSYDGMSGKLLATIRAGGYAPTRAGDALDGAYFPFPGYELPLRIRPDGSQIAAVVAGNVVAGNASNRPDAAVLKVWDAVTGEARWATDGSPPSSVLLDYSPNGASLLIGAFEKGQGSVMVFDAATGQLQRTVSLPAEPKWVDFRSQTIGTVTATEIILCDLTTGKERRRLSGHDGVHHHAISPDGLRLAISRSSTGRRQEMSEVSLWSLQSGSRLLTIKRPGLIGELCFSADSCRLMATYSGEPDDKPIQIWDATPLANR